MSILYATQNIKNTAINNNNFLSEAIYKIEYDRYNLDNKIERIQRLGFCNNEIMKIIKPLFPIQINYKHIDDIIDNIELLLSLGFNKSDTIDFIVKFTKKYMAKVFFHNNINFYKSMFMNIAINLLTKGFNIDTTVSIVFNKNFESIRMMHFIEEINRNHNYMIQDINKFNHIQLDLFFNLLNEGNNINKMFNFIMTCDKDLLEKIYSFASTGVKYNFALVHIMKNK
jgi:hypothetical protein